MSTYISNINPFERRELKVVWSPDLIGSEFFFGEIPTQTTTTTTAGPTTTTAGPTTTTACPTTTTAGPTTTTTIKPVNPYFKNIGMFLLCYDPMIGVVAVLKPEGNRYDGSNVTFKDAPFEFKAKKVAKDTTELNKCKEEISKYLLKSKYSSFPANYCEAVSFSSGEIMNLFFELHPGYDAIVKKIENKKCNYYPGSYISIEPSFLSKKRPSVILSDQEKFMLERAATLYIQDKGLEFTKGLMIASLNSSWQAVHSGSRALIKGLEENELFFHYLASEGSCEPAIIEPPPPSPKGCNACIEVELTIGCTDGVKRTRTGTFTLPSSEEKCWRVGELVTVYLNQAVLCTPTTATTTTTTTAGP